MPERSGSGAPTRLARESAVMAAATIVASAANYGTNVWLARALDIDAFGDAALIVSSLLLLSAVAVAVQLSASHRCTSGDRLGVDALYSRTRRYSGLVGLGLAAASPLLAAWLHSASVASFAVLGLSVPIYLTMAVDRGVMQGEQRFGDLGGSLVVEGVVRLTATVAALVFLGGATAAAVGMAASFAAARLHARYRSGPHRSTSHRSRATTIAVAEPSGPTLTIGWPLMLLLFGQVLIANGDVIVMSAAAPAVAGTFAAVALLGRISFPLAWAIINVAFPKLVDPVQRPGVIRSTTILVAGLAVVTTIGTWIVGPFAASILFGADAAQVTPWLVPYSIATGAFAIATLGAVIDVAAGRRRGAAWLVTFGVIQTFSVAIVAQLGVGAAVWAQVAAMGAAAIVASANNKAVILHPSPATKPTAVASTP